MMETAETKREQILQLVREYHDAKYGEPDAFVPGSSAVPYAGRVFDEDELVHLIDASLDFWLTADRHAAQFETALKSFLASRFALLCNSGSSANLLAVSALTSSKLGDRRLAPGDEVITVAAGFPTTINPIVQNGCVPVFVDVDLETYNIDAAQLERALSPRTKAIILAHTLGNPFNLEAVGRFANDHDLWLIEDNCDALGSRYRNKPTGSFGDLSTISFYPAHQITTGEGGCVVTSDSTLKVLVESFRDWGRDCWCPGGVCDTCNKRFDWQLGELPAGYDHKYIYSHLGYNLKMTDLQAAIGAAQMAKLPDFVRRRRENFSHLFERLRPLEEFFHLPRATPHSEPCWFGFPLTIRAGAPFSRDELLRHFQQHRIATRLLFGGDIRKQPAYADVSYRSVGDLPQTTRILHDTFWLGVYPKLSTAMLDYMADTLQTFVDDRSSATSHSLLSSSKSCLAKPSYRASA